MSEDASVHTETPTNVLNGVDCFSTTVVCDFELMLLIDSLVDVILPNGQNLFFKECFRNSPLGGDDESESNSIRFSFRIYTIQRFINFINLFWQHRYSLFLIQSVTSIVLAALKSS